MDYGHKKSNIISRNFRVFAAVLSVFSIIALTTSAVQAQMLAGSAATLSPINLAQAAPPPQFIPTDVTPFTTAPERNSFSPGYKFRAFQVLPERLWFNFTTEVSQRLDTNVLFTYSKPRADYAFRVLPNLTVGYNIAKNTSLYANYFVIKDVFSNNYNNINSPTTQSLSWGIRHVKQFNAKTTLQYDVQARELWQAQNLHQFDFLPGVTLTHVISPRNIVFASTLLQLRGGNYFVAPTREIDPFYTVGYIHRHGLWTFVANDTLVTNFRHPPFNDAIPNQSNMSMIADLEVNHPVSRKFNGLLAFVRAEPIWNWDSNKVAGISGFDFRFYTGLRIAISKPSYYGAVEDLRRRVLTPEELGKPRVQPVDLTGDDNGNASSGSTSKNESSDATVTTPAATAPVTPPGGVPSLAPAEIPAGGLPLR